MANEVMQSLFGVSPYAAQENLRQQQMAEDMAYARLDPKQQILFNAQQAGRGIGQGINQLFGLVPEPLQRARSIEGALKSVQESGIDMSDPEAYYTAVASALSKAGYQTEAAQVLDKMHSVVPSYLRAAKKGNTERTAVSERNNMLLAETENKLKTKQPVSQEELSRSRHILIGLMSDKHAVNPYTGMPEVIKGNKEYASLYPLTLGMYHGEMEPPIVVDPTKDAVSIQQPEGGVTMAMPTQAPVQQGTALPEQPVPGMSLKDLEQSLEYFKVPVPAGATSWGNALVNIAVSQQKGTTPPGAPAVNPNVFVPQAPTAAPSKTALKKPELPVMPETFVAPRDKAVFDAKLAKYDKDYREWHDQQKFTSDDQKQNEMRKHQNAVLAVQQSAEDRALRKEKTESEEATRARVVTLRSVDSSSKTVLETIQSAVKLISKNPRMVTGLGALANAIPGTPQHQLSQFLTTIKSNVALDKLQELKSSSKTGASGFGAMNIEELKLLLNSMGSVEQTQDPVELVKVLKRIGEHSFNASTYAREDLKGVMKDGAK